MCMNVVGPSVNRVDARLMPSDLGTVSILKSHRTIILYDDAAAVLTPR